MPGFDYSRMQATASRLLDRFSQGTVTLTRTVPGTPNPETPWIPAAPTTTTYTLGATVAAVGDEFVDGSTILATDRMVTAAVFGAEPKPGDTLSIDGKAVTMVKQMRIPAAGTVVAWRFIVRG